MSDCPVWSYDDYYLINQFNFWMEGVLNCCVAFAGFIANIIATFILSRKEMHNSFNMLVTALLCIDSCFLLLSIVKSFRRNFDLGTNLHTLLFPHLIYPSRAIFMSASIFMTVGISIERYIAVHNPIGYNQSLSNSTKANCCHLLKYIIPVLVLSILFNIPKFMEAEVVYLCDECKPQIGVTELRENLNYVVYYNTWARLIVLGLIPTVMLIGLNWKIYKNIKSSQQQQQQHQEQEQQQQQVEKQQQPLSQEQIHYHQTCRQQEKKLASVLILIVVIFLLCHFLRIFLNLYEMMTIEQSLECRRQGKNSFPVWAHIMISFSHLLITCNASTNMVIYCALNTNFRQHFMRLIRCSSYSNSNDSAVQDIEMTTMHSHMETTTV